MALIFGLAPYALILAALIGGTFFLTSFLKLRSRSVARVLGSFFWCAVVWAYLFGDTLPLRYQFHQLCNEDAGIEIHRKIPFSVVDFTESTGVVNWQAVENLLSVERSSQYITVGGEIYTQLLKFYFQENLVATVKIYNYRSGKFLRGIATGGMSCPEIESFSDIYSELLNGD